MIMYSRQKCHLITLVFLVINAIVVLVYHRDIFGAFQKRKMDKIRQIRIFPSGPKTLLNEKDEKWDHNLSHQCIDHLEEKQLHYLLITKLELQPLITSKPKRNGSKEVFGSCDKRSIVYDSNVKKKVRNNYKEMKNRVIGKHPCQYHINLFGQILTKGTHLAVFKLTETNAQQKEVTSYCTGGSIFNAIVTSPNTRTFCHVDDLMNGTYHIFCPVLENRARLNLTQISHNFLFYAKIPVDHKLLFIVDIPDIIPDLAIKNCPALQNNRNSPGNSFQPSMVQAHRLICQGRGYNSIWVRNTEVPSVMEVEMDGSQWSLLVRGKYVQKVTRTELFTCLRKFHNVIILGDSHMRYVVYYILYKLGKLNPELPQRRHDTVSSGNITFLWGAHVDKTITQINMLESQLKNLSKSLAITKSIPDILVINVGHWALAFGDILHFVSGMEQIFEALQKLLNRRRGLMRVVFVGLIPLSDDQSSRLLPSLAANSWVRRRLSEIGIDFFDIGSLVYPFQHYKCGNTHYLCITPKSREIQGKAGLLAYEYLLWYICQ